MGFLYVCFKEEVIVFGVYYLFVSSQQLLNFLQELLRKC